MDNGFLTIGELCQRIGIKGCTLRYWEREFASFLKPYRSKGGHRRYDEDDTRKILKIKELVKDDGYTIKGARKLLQNKKEYTEDIKGNSFPAEGNYFQGKKILITGGTGTVGRELTRKLLSFNPSVIRIYSRDESKQFNMQEEFRSKSIRYFIGDVRDAKRLQMAMEEVDIVFHLAALKHVMACEYNPFEAVNTNIYGSQNIIDVARSLDIEKVIFTGTDKVVNPSSTMGATKLMAERLFTSANYYKGKRRVIFASVRFGNILGSRGSVVPLFKNQMLNGGPVTITDRRMTRFVMSLSEAVKFIFKATLLAKGGEVFVLKMPVVKIMDLIEVIEESLGRHNNIKEIGIKAGEKLYEELMTREEERRALERDDMYIILPALKELRGIKYSYPGVYISKRGNHLSSERGPFLAREEMKDMLQKENLV